MNFRYQKKKQNFNNMYVAKIKTQQFHRHSR
jgi:hypothetical protein